MWSHHKKTKILVADFGTGNYSFKDLHLKEKLRDTFHMFFSFLPFKKI